MPDCVRQLQRNAVQFVNLKNKVGHLRVALNSLLCERETENQCQLRVASCASPQTQKLKINVSCGLRVALKLSEREGLPLVICLVWYWLPASIFCCYYYPETSSPVTESIGFQPKPWRWFFNDSDDDNDSVVTQHSYPCDQRFWLEASVLVTVGKCDSICQQMENQCELRVASCASPQT